MYAWLCQVFNVILCWLCFYGCVVLCEYVYVGWVNGYVDCIADGEF